MQKAVACFGPAAWAIQLLWWTTSLDHSRELEGSNKHATMLASRQHIKFLSKNLQKSECFIFFRCHHFKILVENRPEILESQVVQNHLLTLHAGRHFQHCTIPKVDLEMLSLCRQEKFASAVCAPSMLR
jgi:hypothetical protein